MEAFESPHYFAPDLIVEFDSAAAKLRSEIGQVFHGDDNPVPATGCGLGTVGHGFRRGRHGTGGPKLKIATLQYSRGRPKLLLKVKTKLGCVESDRFIHVIDDVTNLGHVHIP